MSIFFLSTKGRLCGPSYSRINDDSEDEEEPNTRDKERLLPKEKLNLPAPVSNTISDQVCPIFLDKNYFIEYFISSFKKRKCFKLF